MTSTPATRASTSRSLLLLVLGASAALGIGALLGAARQPSSLTASQYSALVHTTGNGYDRWEFQDRQQRLDAAAMTRNFSLREGDENNPTRIVTAIAAQGWELVSHTDSAVCIVPTIHDGTTNGIPDTRRTEQWWFKKK
ncbi:MAG: hypothetical protein ACREJO_09970 [Phycisphaerales bacterium]